MYVLIDNNRINVLDNIISAYKNLMIEKSGQIEVVVKSAKTLDDLDINLLKKNIKKRFFNDELDKEIMIKFVIDETLVQGIVVEYQNKVLDYSLLNKQLSLKEYLEK